MTTDRKALVARIAKAMTHVRSFHYADDGNDGTPCDLCVLAAEQAIEAFDRAGVTLAPSLDDGLRRCSKCGSTNVYVRYDGLHRADRLRCRECGCSWWAKPLAALAQEGGTP